MRNAVIGGCLICGGSLSYLAIIANSEKIVVEFENNRQRLLNCKGCGRRYVLDIQQCRVRPARQ